MLNRRLVLVLCIFLMLDSGKAWLFAPPGVVHIPLRELKYENHLFGYAINAASGAVLGSETRWGEIHMKSNKLMLIDSQSSVTATKYAECGHSCHRGHEHAFQHHQLPHLNVSIVGSSAGDKLIFNKAQMTIPYYDTLEYFDVDHTSPASQNMTTRLFDMVQGVLGLGKGSSTANFFERMSELDELNKVFFFNHKNKKRSVVVGKVGLALNHEKSSMSIGGYDDSLFRGPLRSGDLMAGDDGALAIQFEEINMKSEFNDTRVCDKINNRCELATISTTALTSTVPNNYLAAFCLANQKDLNKTLDFTLQLKLDSFTFALPSMNITCPIKEGSDDFILGLDFVHKHYLAIDYAQSKIALARLK